MCVDEMTGVRILRREQVTANIVPVNLEPVGNYAKVKDTHIIFYFFGNPPFGLDEWRDCDISKYVIHSSS